MSNTKRMNVLTIEVELEPVTVDIGLWNVEGLGNGIDDTVESTRDEVHGNVPRMDQTNNFPGTMQ